MRTPQIWCGGLLAAAVLALAGNPAHGDVPPPRFQPPPPTNIPASPPVDRHETTQGRLEVLQGDLQKTLEALGQPTASRAGGQVPPGHPGGFVEKAMTELKQAQTEIVGALEYVKAHPEINPLPANIALVAVPNIETPQGLGNVNNPKVTSAYPTVGSAIDYLLPCLVNFVNGMGDGRGRPQLADPGGGGPVIGDIGGYRDKILKNVGAATNDLMVGINNLAQNRAVSPLAPDDEKSPAPKPGSISGLVVDTDGDSAPFVLIGLRNQKELTARDNTSRFTRGLAPADPRPLNPGATYPAGIPAAIADDKGAFTITGLPPGIYIVTGSLVGARGGWRLQGSIQPVEVKEGEETKLPAPIKLQ